MCSDHSSGKHYGIFACDGCAGFFKRSIRKVRKYECKAKSDGNCIIDKTHRNQCRACRLHKCFKVGMNKDAVQHERGPRNSTIRRQLALYKDGLTSPSELTPYQSDLVFRPMSMRPPIMSSFDSDLSRVQAYVESQQYISQITPSPHSLTTSVETIVESICETAAQMLFMNIRWQKASCEIHNFSMEEQLLLLRDSWSDLFIIGVCQHLSRFSYNPLLCSYDLLTNKRINLKQNVSAEISQFQGILFKLTYMNVDQKEYDCLRTIALYRSRHQSITGSAGDSPCSTNEQTFQDNTKIINLFDDAIQTLSAYVNLTKPTQNERYDELLLVVQQLKTISSLTIEEMFFKRTIGHVTIVKVMSDMYSQGKV